MGLTNYPRAGKAWSVTGLGHLPGSGSAPCSPFPSTDPAARPCAGVCPSLSQISKCFLRSVWPRPHPCF